MQHKKNYLILAVIVIMAIFLAACVATVPTTAPPAEETAPAAEEVAEAQSAEPVAQGGTTE